MIGNTYSNPPQIEWSLLAFQTVKIFKFVKMAFFKARVIRNDLTNNLENNPNFTLEATLLHKDLSTTIRNESDILYGKILENKGKPWFYTILAYALFDEKPPSEYDNLTRKQINHNAANFLENCGRKFFTYFKKDQQDPKILKNTELKKKVIETIDDFTKNEKSDDPMYAGHFQRFFENFLRWEAFNQEDEIKKILHFLVKKCRTLAYQQLIMRIISDYNGSIDPSIIYSLITIMLKYSFNAVKFIRKKINTDNQISMSTSIKERVKQDKKEKIEPDSQPLNLNKKSMPLVKTVFNKDINGSDLIETQENIQIPWKIDPQLKIETPKYKTIEDAEMEVYLLIMSIRTSISEQSEIIKYFRDEDQVNGYPLIQALMYCGTRCGSQSLISLESFRLLSMIFNGSISLEIDSWNNKEEQKMKLDFYKNYANEINFDPTYLTYKMIHALPVFWNHRYNNDTYKMSEDEKKDVDVSDYYPPFDKPKTRKREEGETALEILQPCLFCDPPISSQLIFNCQDLFIQLLRYRRQLRKIKQKTDEDRDECVRLDGIILDYYQHRFDFGKIKNTTIPNLIKEIVPLEPTNQLYQEIKERRRASLSGFATNFFLTMTSLKLNAFFENEKNPISKMCHCDAFRVNNFGVFLEYKDYTKFEFLSEDTLYNKPIHSEFLFGNGDGEEEEEQIDENLAQNSKSNLILKKPPKEKQRVKVDEMDEMGPIPENDTDQKKKKKKKVKVKKTTDGANKDDDNPNESQKPHKPKRPKQ